MTLEAAHTSESIRAACHANYSEWRRILCEYLIAHGVGADRADALALLTLAAVEGGLILSRAERSAAPLERLAGVIADLVEKERAVTSGAPASPPSSRKQAKRRARLNPPERKPRVRKRREKS